ncbi:MAG: hypothetical protein ACR2OZ_13600 [Verrucomicrobiales bacterium]
MNTNTRKPIHSFFVGVHSWFCCLKFHLLQRLRRNGVLNALGMIQMIAVSGASEVSRLDESTYARWRDYILPARADLGFRQIAWRTSFWDAVIEAQVMERPILLWAMNGHPLGCT